MTKPRDHPLTVEEVRARLQEMREYLGVLTSRPTGSTSAKRAIAGTKAAINVMERKLKEMTNAP